MGKEGKDVHEERTCRLEQGLKSGVTTRWRLFDGGTLDRRAVADERNVIIAIQVAPIRNVHFTKEQFDLGLTC
jgi:hypothetical protein